jgi:hypothetical protein
MLVQSRRALRVLDFDTECRPMHYSEWRAESQLTGIAWSWVGSDDVECIVLKQNLSNERKMLAEFMRAFCQADIVTGHYIRRHDLPLLVDHCIHAGIEMPAQVLASDTKVDLARVRGLGASQENLALTFGLSAEKHRMAGADWRIANTLSKAGQEGTRTRVVSDVIQHKALRAELIERGLLGPPTWWRP